jgi:hypothetical protein
MRHFRLASGFALLITLAAVPGPGLASQVTRCTALDICYCVNTDLLPVIADKIIAIRQTIDDNRKQGKAIGYLSIPLSPAGGGSIEINKKVAQTTADNVTARFGAKSVWLLNPGAQQSAAPDPMANASGADYMYMWTQVLEGRDGAGLGQDFDFFYFTGPSDFAKALPTALQTTGPLTLDQLGDWFDKNASTDPDLKNLTRSGFRNYYGLRASVAVSLGSHDEWNIARLINQRRRDAADLGIPNQLAIFFDGQPVSPGGYESPAAAGDAGRCTK